jgi:hypothetical protein
MKSENKPKTNKISKIYLNDLQNQINTLEKELFSFDNNNSINQEIKVGNLILNKNLEEPLNQNTINVIKTNTEDNNNINTSNCENEAEKDELYNIILRERKEYNELDEVRKIQNEKIKQTQNKCRALERNNYNLRNDMEILQKEKIEQEKKILQLENEINKLKREKNFQ